MILIFNWRVDNNMILIFNWRAAWSYPSGGILWCLGWYFEGTEVLGLDVFSK